MVTFLTNEDEEVILGKVDEKIAAAGLGGGTGGNVDLSDYALKSELPTKVSELDNDVGYMTNYTEKDPTVPAWAKSPTKPSYTASEVGARPSTWMPSYSDVGAEKSGAAASAVSGHNTNTEAHNDIRLELKAINDRLNAFFDSDNQTLDELSEIVAYITNNKALIDSITTSKVNVADIINNLTTNVANKPLSAAQGVALKALIDAIVIPTKVSAFTNDAGYLTQHQDISGKLDASALPTAINTALAQAKASGEFDGKNGTNGKSAYAYAQDGGYAGTEAEFAEKLAAEYALNPLYGKKISLLGDSICAGSNESTSYLGGYGKIIADRNNMVYENVAHAGATVTAETYSRSTGNAKPWLCRMVANMSADADYAIIEGGINDGWDETVKAKVGSITKGYDAELDDTTYYGAFESMLKQLVTKFKGKKIGYIAVPKIHSLYDSSQNAPNFYHIALECCAKWGVSVCDLNTITPPVEYLSDLGTEYTADGTHPTYEGYLKYYCDPIEAWMKTLTTGASVPTGAVPSDLDDKYVSKNDISVKKAQLTLEDGSTVLIDVVVASEGTTIKKYTNQVPKSIDTDGSVFNGTGYQEGYRLSSSGTAKAQAGCVVTGYIPVKAGDVIRIYGCDWATALNSHNYICAYNSSFTFIGANATVNTGTFSLTKYTNNVYVDYTLDDNYNITMTVAALTDIAYIRVSSKGNTSANTATFAPEDMIITVNQEIT